MTNAPAVVLRPVGPGDEAFFGRWGRDPEVRRLYLGRAAADRIGAEELLAPVAPGRCTIVRAIASREGHLLGWVELRDISWRRGSAELRICIGRRDRWNRGFGTQAVRAVVASAFSRWSLSEIHLRVATGNARAIRAYQKCGFAAVGVLRAGRRKQAGFDDLLLMILNRRRWLAREAQARGAEALRPRPAAGWWRPEPAGAPPVAAWRPAGVSVPLGQLGSPV